MRQHLLLGVRGARRISGFALSVILLAAASLALTPATISAAGLTTWASIVLAQNLAMVLSIVGGSGYDVNAPAALATLTREESARYFFMVQRTRLAAALPCSALMVACMMVIPNPDPIAGLLGGAPLMLSIFQTQFYFIGRADPRGFLFTDTVPRAALTFAGAIALALGTPLLIGLTLPVVGSAIAIVLPILMVRKSAAGPTGMPTQLGDCSIGGQLRAQLRPVGSQLLTSGTRAIPVLIITGVAPALLAPFGVFDRLQKQAAAALSPLTASFQEWVPRRMATDKSTRPAVIATVIGIVAAAVLFAAFAVAGSTLIKLFSAGELAPTRLEAILCGAVIATTLLVGFVSYACLVPLAGVESILIANIVGLVATAIALPVMLRIEHSVPQALAALVIGNVAQMIVLFSIMGRYIAKSKY